MGLLSFLSGSGPDFSNVQNGINQQKQISNTFGNLGTTGVNQFAGDNAASRASTNAYADYLDKNPFTNSVNSSIVNRATSGMADAYNRAKSGLLASNLMRGLGAGSSQNVGGTAAIEAARAGTLANAQNNTADYEIENQGNRMGQANALRQGLSAGDQNLAFNGLGQQNNILSNTNGQLANMDEQKYAAEQANGLGAILQPLAGAALNYFTGGVGGLGAKKRQSQPMAQYQPTASDYNSSGYLMGG